MQVPRRNLPHPAARLNHQIMEINTINKSTVAEEEQLCIHMQYSHEARSRELLPQLNSVTLKLVGTRKLGKQHLPGRTPCTCCLFLFTLYSDFFS